MGRIPIPARWQAAEPLVVLATLAVTALACVPGLLQLYGVAGFGPVPLFPVTPLIVFVIGLGFEGAVRKVLLTAAGCGFLLLFALFMALALQSEPLYGLVPAAILAGAVAASRAPVATALTVAAITGAYGGVEAYTSIKHGVAVDFLLLSLWLAAAWSLARGGQPARAWIWPGVIGIGAYLLLTLLSVGFADDTTAALRSFRSSGWYAMSFLLVAYAPWPPGGLKRLTRGLLVVALAVSAYALLRWQIGASPEETELAARTSYTNYLDGELGVVGSFTSRKELAAWGALVLPLCVSYALAMRDGWRAVAGAAAIACAGAVFVTEVRVGLVAALLGVAVTLILLQLAPGLPGARLGIGAVGLIAAVVVGAGAFALTTSGDETSRQRFENILTPENDPSVQARLFKWRTAVKEIDERPFGHGLGTAGIAQIRDGRFLNTASLDLDSGYLKVAYEQGLFLAVLYALAIAALLVGLVLRVLSTQARTGVALGAAGCGALTALLVLMAAGTYQEGLPALAAWLVVGLGVSQFSRVTPTAQPR